MSVDRPGTDKLLDQYASATDRQFRNSHHSIEKIMVEQLRASL